MTVTASYGSWRYEDRKFPNDRSKFGRRGMVMMDYDQYSGEATVYRDVVKPGDNELMFYHRNRPGNVFDYQVRQQELEAVRDQMHDRLTGLTFGGLLSGSGLVLDFRLHAPRQTVVEGQVRDGKLVSWTVTPERRGEHVILMGPKWHESRKQSR